jgi:hypothetical protein
LDFLDFLDFWSPSLAIRERLAQSDPGNAGWQRDLSVSYVNVGNVQVKDLSAALRSPCAICTSPTLP